MSSIINTDNLGNASLEEIQKAGDLLRETIKTKVAQRSSERSMLLPDIRLISHNVNPTPHETYCNWYETIKFAHCERIIEVKIYKSEASVNEKEPVVEIYGSCQDIKNKKTVMVYYQGTEHDYHFDSEATMVTVIVLKILCYHEKSRDQAIKLILNK